MKKDDPQLINWRKQNFAQLELSLQAAMEIRDDPNANHKNKLDAIKTIGRLLGALAQEPIPKKEPPKKESDPKDDIRRALTPAESALIEGILNESKPPAD